MIKHPKNIIYNILYYLFFHFLRSILFVFLTYKAAKAFYLCFGPFFRILLTYLIVHRFIFEKKNILS